MKIAPFIRSLINVRLTDPVFIIGSGRCGSSLLKRIFYSHEQITTFPSEPTKLLHPNSYPFSQKTIDTPPYVENPYEFTRLSVNNWPSNYLQYIYKVFLDYYNYNSSYNDTYIIKSIVVTFCNYSGLFANF